MTTQKQIRIKSTIVKCEQVGGGSLTPGVRGGLSLVPVHE